MKKRKWVFGGISTLTLLGLVAVGIDVHSNDHNVSRIHKMSLQKHGQKTSGPNPPVSRNSETTSINVPDTLGLHLLSLRATNKKTHLVDKTTMNRLTLHLPFPGKVYLSASAGDTTLHSPVKLTLWASHLPKNTSLVLEQETKNPLTMNHGHNAEFVLDANQVNSSGQYTFLMDIFSVSSPKVASVTYLAGIFDKSSGKEIAQSKPLRIVWDK